MRIKPKLSLAFLLLTAVPLAAAGFLSSTMAERALGDQVLLQLESVASIQKSRVQDIFDQNQERLDLVASRTQLRRTFAAYVAARRPEDAELLRLILADALAAIPAFREILLLDPAGRVAASTSPRHEGRDDSGAEHFVRGQAKPGAALFLRTREGALRARLAGPLYWENRLAGVLVIESAADNLEELVRDYTGLGASGETLIARSLPGEAGMFLTPLRYDAGAALARPVSREMGDNPMALALAGRETLLDDALDYRGQRVLAATRALPEHDLGLVVKLDRAEALAPLDRVRHMLMLVTALSVLAVLAAALPVARGMSRPIVDLAGSAARISGGDYSHRAAEAGGGEIADLARAFNTMTQRLVEDLEHRRSAEEGLRARTDLLQGIIDNTLSAVFVKDVNSRFIMANQVFADICGRSRAELLGGASEDIFPPDLARESREMDRLVLSTRRPIQHERTMDLDGKVRTFIATKFPLLSAAGEPMAVCGVYTDISEIKRAAAMREEVERMIRHDLKSPLMAITGLPALIRQEGPLAPRQEEMLTVMAEAGQRMLDIIGLSQDLYRMESGTFRLEPEEVDLAALVRRVAADLGWLAERKRAPLELGLDGAPLAPEARLPAPGRGALLHTMLTNLALNALEATPEGAPVRLDLAREPEALVLTVRNQGVAPREIRSRFFGKYVSLGKKGGFGLGAYNAKLIAEAHGGSIAMESSEAEGATTIRVRLPRRWPPPSPA